MPQKRARSQEAIEQRQQDILNAARKLFLVKSYDQISLVSLAKQLDISRPSFYTYFSSKDALFLHLLKEEGLDFAVEMQEHFKSPLLLEDFCTDLIKLVLNKPLFIKLLSVPFTNFHCSQTDEDLLQFRAEVRPFFKTLFQIFKQQFPKTPDAEIWSDIRKYYLLISTIANYDFFAQIQVEEKLDFFGSDSSSSTTQFYSDMLYKLYQNYR